MLFESRIPLVVFLNVKNFNVVLRRWLVIVVFDVEVLGESPIHKLREQDL